MSEVFGVEYLRGVAGGGVVPRVVELRRALGPVRDLGRRPVFRGLFSSMGQFVDGTEERWRCFGDPFLLARLSAVLGGRVDECVEQPDRLWVVEGLGEADVVWSGLRAAVEAVEPGRRKDDLEGVLDRCLTGRTWQNDPSLPKHGLIVSVVRPWLVPFASVLDGSFHVEWDLSDAFGLTAEWRGWCEAQGVDFLDLLVQVRWRGRKKDLAEVKPVKRRGASVLQVGVRLEGKELQGWVSSGVGFHEVGRRLFVGAMADLVRGDFWVVRRVG